MSKIPSTPTQESVNTYAEFSVWEIIETLRKHWRTVVAFKLATLFLALSIGLVWPKHYEATVLIQVARVGNPQTAMSGGGTTTSGVESNASVIARLQSSSFESRLRQHVPGPISIKATEPKGTGLVLITARAASQENARKTATLALNMLTEVHSVKTKEALAILRQALEATKKESSQTAAQLNDLLTKTDHNGRNDPLLALMRSQLQASIISQQQNQKERQLRLELALSTPSTNQTQAIEEIYSSDEPVGLKYPIIGLFGLIGGGFLGMLAVLTRQALQNRQSTSRIFKTSNDE